MKSRVHVYTTTEDHLSHSQHASIDQSKCETSGVEFIMRASMALSVAACCVSCVSAFVVPTLARGICPTSTATAHSQSAASYRVAVGVLSAEKEAGAEEEQEPMDLDLEQMFEVQPIGIADGPVFVLSAAVLMC